jgi:transglutaminase-like putative cysteine protease
LAKASLRPQRGIDVRFILATIFLVSLFMAGSALADNGQVKRGPAPQWVRQSDPLPVPADATGATFFRRQDALIHLDSWGEEQYVGYRVRILQSSALELGNIAISWNPAAGSPTVHAIRIYRGTDVIDVLKTTSFEVLRREDQLEAAKLDGMLTAVLRVADLRVGDELEVSYTIRANDPTLGTDDAGILFLGPSPLPGRYRLEVSWDKDRKPNLKTTPDLVSVAKASDQAVEFQFDNPAVLSPPKDAPPRFQWQRIVEFSSFADWAAVSRRLAPLFASASDLSAGSPLKQEATRITASVPTTLGRAGAALKLVQQNIRYIYIGLDRGNLTPATADETWQRRYGDCKAKTALLLALLREMGIEAVPVLVNNYGTDDGLDERLPSPRMFDHVLVRAHIDGKWYWLDGTMPSVVGPGLIPTLSYRWVLPLTAQGSALQHIDWYPANQPNEIHLFDIDARSGFDQPAHVVSTSILRGIDGLQQYVQLSAATADQLTNAFRQRLVGGDWQTIDVVKWHYDEKAQASVLTITGTWKLDWEDDGGGARSLALPGGGFNPPDRRGRAADQDQNAPYYNKPEYSCYATTVRLPASTRAGQWTSKPGFDTHIFGRNYYRAFALKGAAIRMIRGSRIERDEIDADTARRDNDRIPAFDNSKGYIFFDPTGQQNPIASDGNVPATDEIDWTADTVPCLTQAARNYTALAPK